MFSNQAFNTEISGHMKVWAHLPMPLGTAIASIGTPSRVPNSQEMEERKDALLFRLQNGPNAVALDLYRFWNLDLDGEYIWIIQFICNIQYTVHMCLNYSKFCLY